MAREAAFLSRDAMRSLVEEGRLKRVDILLTHSRGSLIGRLIRFGTKSYWNHAALVYVLRDADKGYQQTFIIESGGEGIDIHNISRFLGPGRKTDVAVLRLEAPWFQEDLQRYIRGLALQEIDAKYDYGMIVHIGRWLLRGVIQGLVYGFLRFKPEGLRRVRRPGLARALRVDSYICSGFVQWAYYEGVRSYLKDEGKSAVASLGQVSFNPELESEADEETLLSTTPADLAQTPQLTWKYLVKGGVVWEITHRDQVAAILSGKARPRRGS